MAQNTSKNRKSESQEIFEQANNVGRFAGNDTDAKSAKRPAEENIGTMRNLPGKERNKDEATDAEARRDSSQKHNYKGEAENVNADSGRPLRKEETERVRNKKASGRTGTITEKEKAPDLFFDTGRSQYLLTNPMLLTE